MNNVYKVKAKYNFLWASVLLLLLITQFGHGELLHTEFFHNTLTADTPPRPRGARQLDSQTVKTIRQIYRNDSLKNANRADSVVPKVDSFSIKYSKDSLDAPVVYHADDSMVLDVPGKKIYLYGKESKTTYQDNELTAPNIQYDQKTNLVTAYMLKDSAGNVIKYARFKQGDFESASDSLVFNMLTQKGLTKGTYFTQNEMYVYTEKSKKIDSNTVYARNTRFTTCNLDTPHFAFVSRKVKFINKKIAFTGPVHPEFEGVPIPIVLPFGIYPLKQGRHSGILAPTFTVNEQLGLALDGIGYYKVLNDNWDITTRGTLYSYGGWTATVSPRYYKRYRYSGNFSLDVQHYNFGLKTDKSFQKTRSFNIRWNHTADSKARPGVTFTASVNAGSSKFNQYVPNSPVRNFQNRLNSSISYAKVWKDKPFNLTITANHNQNTVDKTIVLDLPDIGFNLNTIYPFRRKETIGELKWYENVGIALNSNIKSHTDFSDSTGAIDIITQARKNFQWGASHNIPITLSLPQLGAFQVSPGVSLQEKWFQKKFVRKWNPTAKKVDTVITPGFYTANDMSYSLGVSTRIFGMFQFKKSSKIQAIRHEIRPNFGIAYKPDLNGKFFYNTQVDTFGHTGRFSVYDGSVFGSFSEGKFGGITFGIDNNLQMKVKSRKDTGEASLKKISLIDGFSLNGSYNLMADSFALSNFSVSARSNLFDKINITAFANLDPYDVDAFGKRINTLLWKRKPVSLGRLVNGGISMSSQFKGGNGKGKTTSNPLDDKSIRQQYNPVTGMPLDEYQQEAAYIAANPGEFADFSIPWSVNLSYTLNFYKVIKPDYSGFRNVFTQDVNFNGDLNITPRWKFGATGSYNITTKDLGLLTMYLSREMHCWQMSINISPIGSYRYFNISISPKSGLLRDLKVNRTRSFYDF